MARHGDGEATSSSRHLIRSAYLVIGYGANTSPCPPAGEETTTRGLENTLELPPKNAHFFCLLNLRIGVGGWWLVVGGRSLLVAH